VFGFNLAPSLELQYKPGRDTKRQRAENNQKFMAAFTTLLAKIREDEKDRLTLGKLIPFGIFKAISEFAKDTMPADYKYYKSKKEYYYDIQIPTFKKWMANRVVKKEVDKMLNPPKSSL
jgi:hypothetical protein